VSARRSLTRFLSVSSLVHRFAFSRWWVPSARSFLFRVLICPSLFPLQDVSLPRPLTSFPCPHLFVVLRSPDGECPLLALFLSVSSLVHFSALSRKSVPLARSLSFRILTCLLSCALQNVSAPRSLSFRVLTCPSLCTLQWVSAPRSLAFFPCPHLCIVLRSPVGECPSLARFLSVFSLVRRSALSRR
jgi:hypothetical protein